jgi:hypothetical protein
VQKREIAANYKCSCAQPFSTFYGYHTPQKGKKYLPVNHTHLVPVSLSADSPLFIPIYLGINRPPTVENSKEGFCCFSATSRNIFCLSFRLFPKLSASCGSERTRPISGARRNAIPFGHTVLSRPTGFIINKLIIFTKSCTYNYSIE